MDVPDDQGKLSKPSNTVPQQNVSSPLDHIIPQMVITSAEGTPEEEKNVSECTLVLIPPSNGHSTDRSEKDTSTEFRECANSVSEEKSIVDFEDISVVVRDVVSKCTESVSHSVRQRPLVIEVDKNVSQQEACKDSSSIKCPPPPPPLPSPISNVTPPPPQLPSVSPPSTTAPIVTSPSTAMQRPLVFEAIVSKTEVVSEVQKDTPVKKSTEVKDEPFFDKVHLETQLTSEVPVEDARSSEKCTTPTKKEGLQGVKKFFDSLWHPEIQESGVKFEEPDSSKESDISPDVTKGGKNVKFFQSPKDSTKSEQSHSPEVWCENKESTSFAKDAKQNIKSFFDSFKHETVDSKDITGTNTMLDSPKEISGEKNVQTSSDISKESKDVASFAKDTKQNIKSFFDTFKHEPSEQKPKSGQDKKLSPINIGSECQAEKNLQSPISESPKESTSFAKDTKQNIKAFFDTFKHETSEQKAKSNISKKTVSQPNICEGTDNEKVRQSASPENIKEPKDSTSFAKDTKQNIKAFFDTLKHEPSEQKPKTSVTKKSISQPDVGQEGCTEKNIEPSILGSPKESSSFVKDTKQNIKLFFDTFKHESSDTKQNESTYKKSASHSDFTSVSKEIDSSLQESSPLKNKESVSFAKGAKQNVKSFFETFKHEPSASKVEDAQKNLENDQLQQINEPSYVLDHYGGNTRPVENNKESVPVTPTDTKQDVKPFFDTLNKENLSKKPTASEPNLHKEPADSRVSHHKDTKNPIKKFFSFKHIGEHESISPELSGSLDSQLPKESKKDKPLKVTKSVKLDLDPKYSSNGTENLSASYSHMNGHETEVISETKERAQSVPSDAIRKSKNFDVIPKIKKPEGTTFSCSDSPVEKSGDHKDSRQGIKKFFDSFRHEKSGAEKDSSLSVSTKKESLKDLNSIDLASGSSESKIAEKPTKDKKSKSIKRSLSDKVSREEVVQNFKGFFDSISHKSPSKKSVRDSEHIYDVVEVKPEISSPAPIIHISDETKPPKSSAVKSETQGMKKILSPFRSKHTSKGDSENIDVTQDKTDKLAEENLTKGYKLQNSSDLAKDLPQSASSYVKDSTVTDFSPTVSEPSSPKPDKSSVFSAIGENILSLKEKMMHTKDKRKSELVEDSIEISDKSKIDEIGKETVQTSSLPSTSNDSHKENIKTKPVPAEKPKQIKDVSKDQTYQMVNKPETVKETSSAHPSSLYDTCCMKIAVLLRDKALDIVTEHTKSPPPKPPKPSAEAIAKARAAAVSRRLADAQKIGYSIGESLPLGCDGFRFADDETESSCDYKDVENFNYIMDYDLNRYKIDSNKLDTFSVPSTCSGLTSYYTADTVTSRDEIYSDTIMETISLSSDVSYNLKQLPSSPKSEPKISGVAVKENKTVVSGSKQPATKKVPPPIPPKPVILQNISKIKGKSDDKTISQCVNGLSLSPRLQNKFSKDPAATQKRPLMVADIKGTQFSSLQHPKKSAPQKPVRNFDTVLKNESLKTVPCVSSDSVCTGTGKISKTEPSLQSDVKIEKRTISPPRPPLPNLIKKPEKPPKPERPPPPIKSSKGSSDEIIEEKCEKLEFDNINQVENLSEEKVPDLSIQSTSEKKDMDSNVVKSFLKDSAELQEVSDTDIAISRSKPQTTEIIGDYCESDLKIQQDNLNNNVETNKAISDSLNNNIEINENISTENPKPPPRNRRIRSRTVEVIPTEKKEERVKRSQSLTEIDIQKRVTFLTAEKTAFDSKSLYTTVNKNGKRSNSERTSQSSPDLVSCRPLPAPPPPPRRFRSLERKGKSKKLGEEKVDVQNYNSEQISISPVPSEDSIKAPSRRRKTDKQRFFSLHSDHRTEISKSPENVKRAESVPTKPDRKMKSSVFTKYDVNANIANLQMSEENLNLSNQSIPSVDTPDSLRTKSKIKKDGDSRERSHSSWYDENETVEGSWELVDTVPASDFIEEYKLSPKVPMRRKLETRRKSRETSKFYVNMEGDKSVSPVVDEGSSPLPHIYKSVSPLPLVDKETSPIALDCSEKSVQTSLETLSQGIVSHDDQSDDTDELLDLAQTLQKELSVIINRHKTVNESNEDTPSPPLSAATSEKNLAEGFKDIKKSSSVRSSTSEVWPVTSSDESDIERVGEDSSNINEIAIKRKQKKIYYIAREIMTSEEAFVDALKLLNVDFKAAVEAANKQKNMTIIPDEMLAQILNHLPQLQHLNENLLMELKDRIRNWDKHEKIADIIVKMGPFLKLYSWYIHDFESNVSLLEECKKKFPAFAQLVKEFEMTERCKRLALNHYMLKPIQRIPQYRLLLQEYLHHLMEDSKDYQDTVAALQIVSEVANHANDSMKQGDNAQKLISIQNSIIGHKEIVKPGRVFVKEGELMKLSRKGMQPRWFVLFNDLLLYLTPVQQGLFRINHDLPLTGMKVAIPIQQDYQNEFSIISVTRSFTLAARSQEERQEWIIALTKAIEENASKRSTFTNSRLNQKAQDKTSSEDEAAFVLGKKAPVWIPDARVTMCQLCTSEFTVTFRRHHCRACGKVVCSICSSHRISLPYLGNRIARVCDECHIRLGQGSSACTESGETDSDNQQIAVKSHLRTDNRHTKKGKRMLPSVLKEVCANDQGSTISGYLHKRTGKSWKRDWFVVKDKVLYEYKASEDVAALRSIPLLGYQIELFSEASEGIDSSLLFQLSHPGQAPIMFYADTVGSAERWVSALKTATVLE